MPKDGSSKPKKLASPKIVTKQPPAQPTFKEAELSCKLCRNEYEMPRRFMRDDDFQFSKIPKLLDCLHTYCQSCIQDAIERVPAPACFTCPDCNRRQAIPDIVCGTSALMNDYTVLRALKEKEESKLDEDLDCDECVDETPATHRCLDCGGHRLCEFHLEGHSRSRSFKTHRVFRMEEYKAQTASIMAATGLSRCHVHDGAPLEHYCQDCDVVLCTDCRAAGHTAHSCMPVAEIAKHHRKRLNTGLDDMVKGLEGLKSTIDKIAASIKTVTENTEDTEKAIRLVFSQIRRELDVRERQLLQMVEEKQAHKLEALGKKRITLDQALTDLENTLEVSDRSLACLQDSDLVLMSKPIWRKIQGVSMSVQEVNNFDVSEECRQVAFVCSARERDVLSLNSAKLGAVVEEPGDGDGTDYLLSATLGLSLGGSGGRLMGGKNEPPGSVQVEFLIVSAVNRSHVVKRPAQSDDIIIEVREVVKQPPANPVAKSSPESLPKAKGAKASAADTSKPDTAGPTKPEANESQPTPPPGPVVGRLVISMPVENPNPGLRNYNLMHSYESIERPGHVPTLRVIKGVKLM